MNPAMNPAMHPARTTEQNHKTLPKMDGLYWALVISSTTLGETAGDLISQTLGLGYGGATAVLLGMFIVAMVVEVTRRKSHAGLYWTTLTLASIGGTTLSDWAARTLGLGYPISAVVVFAALIVALVAWKLSTRSLDLKGELTRRAESLYWLAIFASSTLGTVIGDLLSKDELDLGEVIGADGKSFIERSLSDTMFGEWISSHGIHQAGLGFGDDTTAMVLLGLLAVVTCVALFTRVSRMTCYWAGIIVTHPLGAAAGDYMTKEDGLDMGNTKASAILLVVLLAVAGFAYFVSRAWCKKDDAPGQARGVA